VGLVSHTRRTLVALGGLVRRRRQGQASGRRLHAGEALILRGEGGRYVAVPIDVLAASSLEPATMQERDSSSRRFAFASARFGPLEFLGVNDHALILRDRLGARLAIPRSVLGPAHVPPESAPELEAQLAPVDRPAPVDGGPFGRLHLLGSFQFSYESDPQDSDRPVGGSATDEHHLPTAPVQLELAEARQAFFRAGWCTLSGEAFHRKLGRLAEEAQTLVRAASHEYEIASEDKLSIRIKRYATTGPALESVHHDPAVVSVLRALSGIMVVPTQVAYYFYDGTGFISVHTDASHCPLAMLVKVFGDPPSLMAYPELRGCSPETLSALAHRGGDDPEGGEPMPFPRDGGAVLFEGCALPHYRPRGDHGREFVGVAQLCYRSVWRQTRPPRTMVAARPLTSVAER